MRLPSPFVLVAGCFLLSGFAGLVYETVWMQQFAVVFGTAELALATVLAAYMTGLAGGAAVAARTAGRTRHPLRLYALLEFGIALSALAVPWGIRLAGKAHRVFLGGEDLAATDGSSTLAVYAATSFAILLVPTALMGATLPLVARHVVRRESQIGARVGALYTVNTVGAAVGTLAAAFVLLPRLGLTGAVWVAVGVNLLVFLLAVALSATSVEDAEAPQLAPEAPPAASEERRFPWILPLVMISGAVSFTLEILWTRLLTLLLGGSVYAFATMLASFLVGIAVGAACGARLATSRRRALVGFSASQVVAAGLTLVAFWFSKSLPAIARSLPIESGSFGGLVAMAALCALTLLPAAVAFGATFPLAVRTLARHAADASSASGRVFAWNTAGAILGSLATGFFVLPALGFATTAMAAAGVCVLLALASLAPVLPRRPGRTLSLPLSAIVVVATLLITGTFLWNPGEPESLLRYRVLHHDIGNDTETTAQNKTALEPPDGSTGYPGTIRHLGVGRSATIVLFEQRHQWRLVSNGLPESAILPSWGRAGWGVVARWLSLLPVAARPETESLLVVGLGAGVTVEDVPSSVREIHVVELEPEVVQANRSVASLRRKDPLADPRLQLHLGDARGTLQRTQRTFDAIVSQPSHPWTAGASHLFTREFFTLARERLTARGVFVQWMGLPFVDADLLRSLVATLCDVFPHVEIYQPGNGALLFLASREPLDLDTTAGEALTANPGPWALVGVTTPAEITMVRVLDAEGSRRFAAGGRVSTDGRNLLRTRSPRVLAGRSLKAGGVDPLFAPWDPLAEGLDGSKGSLAVLRRLAESGHFQRSQRLAGSLGDHVDRSAARGLALLAAGRYEAARSPLFQALALDRTSEAARAGVLRLHRGAVEAGLRPADVTSLGELSAAESLLVTGWGLAGKENWRAFEGIDDALQNLPPEHPLHREAVRLRVRWRIGFASSAAPPTGSLENVGAARKAMELVEPLLAPRAEAGDLLLRAEAAAAVGEPLTVLATLAEAQRLAPTISPAVRDRAEAVLQSLQGVKGTGMQGALDADETERWRRDLLARYRTPAHNGDGP